MGYPLLRLLLNRQNGTPPLPAHRAAEVNAFSYCDTNIPTMAGGPQDPSKVISALAPLARMAKMAAAQIARSRLLIRASSNTNAHNCVCSSALRRLVALRFPPEGICRHSPVRGMFASRIGPPTNAAYFDSVLTNPKTVNSMLLKHPSHRTALWMNLARMERERTSQTLARNCPNRVATELRAYQPWILSQPWPIPCDLRQTVSQKRET